MAGNLLGTIRLPISLRRSKHRIAALRQFPWLQHLSPIPDHFIQRDLNEAALRRTLRVAGQVPITPQKRGLRRPDGVRLQGQRGLSQADFGGVCKISLVRAPGMSITSSGSSLDRAGLFLPPLNVHAHHEEPPHHRSLPGEAEGQIVGDSLRAAVTHRSANPNRETPSTRSEFEAERST
jgi:hypothetical protein